MDSKDLYIEQLKKQLDLWGDDLEQMEAQAHMAEADLKIRYLDQLEALRQQREKVRHQLTQVRESGDQEWEELKENVDEAYQKVTAAFSEARNKFK